MESLESSSLLREADREAVSMFDLVHLPAMSRVLF